MVKTSAIAQLFVVLFCAREFLMQQTSEKEQQSKRTRELIWRIEERD